MKVRFACLVVAIVATVAMTACGSTPQTDAADAATDSTSTVSTSETSFARSKSVRPSLCTVLPKAEMEELLGGPLANVDAADTPAKTQCTYAGFGGRFADVAIEWGNGEAGMAGARLASRLMGNAAPGIDVVTALEGLGDEAVLMIGGVLNVRKGADLITVDLRTQKNPEVVAPAIVRKIIEQM